MISSIRFTRVAGAPRVPNVTVAGVCSAPAHAEHQAKASRQSPFAAMIGLHRHDAHDDLRAG
jgi:hypothetical protein